MAPRRSPTTRRSSPVPGKARCSYGFTRPASSIRNSPGYRPGPIRRVARWRGAQVTATASAANLDFVRTLGADEVIDYRAERFEDVVRHVDVVFDTVGGETLERSWSVLKPGGRLVTVAASGERTTDERIRAAYFIVEPSRTQLVEIARLIDGGAVRPVVGAVFPLAEARQAYQHKPVRGKIVLRVVDGGGAM